MESDELDESDYATPRWISIYMAVILALSTGLAIFVLATRG